MKPGAINLCDPDTNLLVGDGRPGLQEVLNAHSALGLSPDTGAGRNDQRLSVVLTVFLFSNISTFSRDCCFSFPGFCLSHSDSSYKGRSDFLYSRMSCTRH
jgi:hypothetical protein